MNKNVDIYIIMYNYNVLFSMQNFLVNADPFIPLSDDFHMSWLLLFIGKKIVKIQNANSFYTLQQKKNCDLWLKAMIRLSLFHYLWLAVVFRKTKQNKRICIIICTHKHTFCEGINNERKKNLYILNIWKKLAHLYYSSSTSFVCLMWNKLEKKKFNRKTYKTIMLHYQSLR